MNQILCLLMSIVLTFADGTEKVYDDAEVTAVEIDDDTNTVTVNTTHGTDTYKDMVLAIGTRADEPAPVANNLITEDGVPYILDWSHATQGNASADVARTYLLFWLDGNIEGAKKYMELFCKKSDTAKQYIEKWLPIVAASQSVKGNAKEREFLLSWVDVVDYE